MANYIHSIPGRLRVKIASIKSSPQTEEAIEDLLRCLHGIDTVSINPLTANVLITYNPKAIRSEEILKVLTKEGFLGTEERGDEGNWEMMGSRTRQAVGKALFGWAVGKALEDTGLSFLAAFI